MNRSQLQQMIREELQSTMQNTSDSDKVQASAQSLRKGFLTYSKQQMQGFSQQEIEQLQILLSKLMSLIPEKELSPLMKNLVMYVNKAAKIK